MEIIIHDYLGGPNVISRILIGGKQEIRERERRCVDKIKRLEECEGQPLEGEKGQENRLFPEDSRKNSS